MPKTPDGGELEDALGFHLHRTAAALKMSMKRAFKAAGHDATPEEFIALNLLVGEGLDQGSIAAKTGKEKSNVTRLVDRLVDRGWVRRASGEDRRVQHVSLTQEGDRQAAELRKVVYATVLPVLDDIPKRDVEATRRTLRKLFERLG